MAARVGFAIDGCGPDLLCPDSSRPSEEEEIGDALPLSWPDSEYGLPPCPGCTYAEYCKSVADGDVSRFKELEQLCTGWWTPTLDRGSGGLLHIAADHGQLDMYVLRRVWQRISRGAGGGVRLDVTLTRSRRSNQVSFPPGRADLGGEPPG